jgi:4-hydroxybenzoate polyprenyltransferase
MFNKAIDFLKLIRFNNLLIIGLTQTFAYYFLSPSIRLSDVFSIDFILLLSSTFLVAGAGYIINDYMDVMLDLVNKPDKVIVGKSISRRWAMLLHFGMNFLAKR